VHLLVCDDRYLWHNIRDMLTKKDSKRFWRNNSNFKLVITRRITVTIWRAEEDDENFNQDTPVPPPWFEIGNNSSKNQWRDRLNHINLMTAILKSQVTGLSSSIILIWLYRDDRKPVFCWEWQIAEISVRSVKQTSLDIRCPWCQMTFVPLCVSPDIRLRA
jgi:hypothetical protein